MKPTEKFIEWLQAHPAVWEALQEEWGPQVGDWCLARDEKEAYGPVYVARWQLPEQESGSHRTTWVVVMTPDTGMVYVGPGSIGTIKVEFRWLPTLGQLVRLVEEELRGTRLDVGLHYDTAFVEWCAWKGGATVSTEKIPEIACLALWAKVKSINV